MPATIKIIRFKCFHYIIGNSVHAALRIRARVDNAFRAIVHWT